MEYARELEFTVKTARAAGEIMLQYFDGNQGIEIKDDGSPVTVADKMINSVVIEALSREFPDDGVIGEEESTTDHGKGRKWICDPIDGTAAFVWGVPTSMFSLGLVIDGQPTVGVAYDPYLDRMFTAVKHQGSYRNGEKLQVSSAKLDTGIVAVSGRPENISNGLEHIEKLLLDKVILATYSGAVHKSCLVASGRFVGYIEEGVHAHDMAAVSLIVSEAGGKVTDLKGNALDFSKPFRGSVVSNGVVHDALIGAIGK